VTVDGKPEKILRCNYLMRGVQLTPGEHKVELVFKPDIRALHITLAAMGVGLLAAILLIAAANPVSPLESRRQVDAPTIRLKCD